MLRVQTRDHEKAANHHELASKHHVDAAKCCESGDHETAAHPASLLGHDERAV